MPKLLSFINQKIAIKPLVLTIISLIVVIVFYFAPSFISSGHNYVLIINDTIDIFPSSTLSINGGFVSQLHLDTDFYLTAPALYVLSIFHTIIFCLFIFSSIATYKNKLFFYAMPFYFLWSIFIYAWRFHDATHHESLYIDSSSIPAGYMFYNVLFLFLLISCLVFSILVIASFHIKQLVPLTKKQRHTRPHKPTKSERIAELERQVEELKRDNQKDA